ncbi:MULTISPECIES: GNAT family N-acetyltransferase [Bacillus]|nr:GNAT family N-acetyltransferase [Bacillus glycinifermentans]NUJ19731.1 GNAT family N-acetyltransferase [Bacillus glycinifermentans]WKB78832.1 GNAT family N-acetyltransferase [Bacillus glycinifermentans]SCA85386.1 GNAT family acetyltransferase [Bacillus glycinifermentans]
MAQLVELFDEVLSPEHRSKVDNFKCESEKDVEIFLKKDSWELQEYNMTLTRLFFNKDGDLVGYFTLFNESVPKVGKDKLIKENWKLPNSEKSYPAVRLHYLGVDERYQKQGIGYTILISAIDVCTKISKLSGCTFVSVQALNSAVEFYEKYHFKRVATEKKYVNMLLKLEDAEE